jgi:hypothetical protein
MIALKQRLVQSPDEPPRPRISERASVIPIGWQTRMAEPVHDITALPWRGGFVPATGFRNDGVGPGRAHPVRVHRFRSSPYLAARFRCGLG